jgi:hypothetical protein
MTQESIDKHQIPKDISFDGSLSPELVKLIAELVYEMFKEDIRRAAERRGQAQQLGKHW